MKKKILVGLKLGLIYFLATSTIGFTIGCVTYYLYFQDKFASLSKMPWGSLGFYAGLPSLLLTCVLAIVIGGIAAVTTPTLIVIQQRILATFLSFLGGVICGILADGLFAIASTLGHVEPALEMIPAYTIIFGLLSPMAGILTTWHTHHEIILKKLYLDDNSSKIF